MTSAAPQVVHVTAWYGPEQVGGTEIYLEGLVAGLNARGVTSEVMTPRPGDPRRYRHNGAWVSTFPPGSLPAFEAVLGRVAAPVYHQHSWTPDCGLEHLRIARRLGMRTVTTVHAPGVNCLRGTMMLYGETACDGLITERRCGACWARSRGARWPADQILGLIPHGLVDRAGGEGGWMTALAATSLAHAKAEQVAEMAELSDRVVAVCEWLRAALALNGVPAEKLMMSRQGVEDGFGRTIPLKEDRGAAPLKLLYLGRWHAFKGIDVVVRAIRLLPTEVSVRLTIHAVASGAEEEAYRAEIEALCTDEPRIEIGDAVPRDDLDRRMAAFDVLVVPSVWLETGPLVVLEALAAGLYVIGSDLGGVAELVEAPRDGLLPKTGDAPSWAEAIKSAAARRREGPLASPRRVRTMADAASDMAALYQSFGINAS